MSGINLGQIWGQFGSSSKVEKLCNYDVEIDDNLRLATTS